MSNFKTRTIILLALFAGAFLGAGSTYVAMRGNTTKPAGAQGQASLTAPSNSLFVLSGNVQGVQGNLISITSSQPGEVDRRLAVVESTQLVIQGMLKDTAVRDKELEAFRLESQVLAQNSDKNHEELQKLIAPSIYQETPARISDVSVGDQIFAYVDGQESDGTYSAHKIVIIKK